MRLIDADALYKRMNHDAFEVDSDMQKWDSGCWIRFKMFENAMKDAPTVDAVEVVRCKECKHWKQTDEIPVHYGECLDSIFGYVAPREDFFCANGERRSE